MQTIVIMLAAAQLPPPPEPEAVANGNAGLVILLVSVGLAVVVILALMLVLLRRRAAASHPEREPPSTSTYRIDHWRDGTAVIVGYSNDPAAKNELLTIHAARLREQGARGSLVLVEQATDDLIALKPLAKEERPDQQIVDDATGSSGMESRNQDDRAR